MKRLILIAGITIALYVGLPNEGLTQGDDARSHVAFDYSKNTVTNTSAKVIIVTWEFTVQTATGAKQETGSVTLFPHASSGMPQGGGNVYLKSVVYMQP